MNNRNLWRALGFTALAAALVIPSSAAAQDTAREGIHVQGDWVIEVRNSDGSVADRREFSNDLVGPQYLAWSLSPAGSASIEMIRLTNCYEDAGAAVPCFLDVTSNQDGEGGNVGTGANPTSLVLEGSITTSLPGLSTTSVTDVATMVVVCSTNQECVTGPVTDPLVPGEAAFGGAVFPVTSTTLATPVDVADGQTIVVTVTITFN